MRDLYEVEDGNLLMVASDRISAYDFLLTPGIPDKGEILTRMSLWWFDQLSDIVPNHVVSTAVPERVRGRALIVEKLEMFPVECVARGYLTGSGLSDYDATGEVCGVPLPAGLVDASRLPEPIFTPATKAAMGEHDENVSFEQITETIGAESAEALRDLTLRSTRGPSRSPASAASSWRTPSSSSVRGPTARSSSPTRCSRRTPRASGRPTRGSPAAQQPSYDKQFVRDWLTSPESGWDRASNRQPPALPAEIVEKTRERYVQAYEQLTGETF